MYLSLASTSGPDTRTLVNLLQKMKNEDAVKVKCSWHINISSSIYGI